MIKLIVKDPGLTLNLTGIAQVRTPVEIDITRLDINLLVTELRSNGVENYNIESVSEVEELTVQKKKEEKPDDKVVKRLSNIEQLLEQMLERDYVPIIQPSDKNESLVEKLEESFIPSVDTEGLKIQGNVSKTTETDRENIDENADLLRKMSRKKENNSN